jgi:acyl-CoA thioester hydrolase
MKRLARHIQPGWDRHAVRFPVRFHEVDSMEVVWHGHYVAWCETAREAWLGARGLSYQDMQRHGCPAPVVRMVLDYLRPARAGDTVEVVCAHIPGGEPKLECAYEVRSDTGDLLCLAESMQVFVDREGQVRLSAPPPVEALFAAIAAARSRDGSPG